MLKITRKQTYRYIDHTHILNYTTKNVSFSTQFVFVFFYSTVSFRVFFLLLSYCVHPYKVFLK